MNALRIALSNLAVLGAVALLGWAVTNVLAYLLTTKKAPAQTAGAGEEK